MADLSHWYVRCSRRRFWDGHESALRELWAALITCLRLLSPIMPFLTENLWQRLVRAVLPTAPVSIFLAGWPEVSRPDDGLLQEMEDARRAVELGRQARAKSGQRTRQPLRQARIDGLDGSRFAALIADELRVKAPEFGTLAATRPKVKLNYRLLGPRLGPAVTDVAAAIGRGEYELRDDGSVLAAGRVLGADEIFTEGDTLAGWTVASLDGLTVAVTTTLDDDLIRDGRANDIVRAVNAARKKLGLRIEDRIKLTLPVTAADLESHFPIIASETLATSIAVGLLAAADGPFQITPVTNAGEPSPADRR